MKSPMAPPSMLPSVETKPTTSRKLRVSLRDADSLLLHLDRQQRLCKREFVLYLNLSGVRVRSLLERQRDIHAAVFSARLRRSTCRWSRPLSCCSITWTTVLCTVSAEAPGYVTLIEINGGAIAGYCAIGSERMERPPANMMTIAITQAKIGRSMKKLTISALQRQAACVDTRRAPFDRAHGRAGLDLLPTLDNQALADRDAAAHQPSIANRACRAQRPLLDFVLAIDDQRHGLTPCVVCDTLLRNEQPVVVDGLRDECAHVHARQQESIRIREPCPQPDHTGGFIDGDVGEGQHAHVLVFAAVVEPQSDLDRVLAGAAQAPARELPLQPQELVARLCDVDIDRIELTHGRQRIRLIRGHQCARRED